MWDILDDLRDIIECDKVYLLWCLWPHKACTITRPKDGDDDKTQEEVRRQVGLLVRIDVSCEDMQFLTVK